MLRDFRDFAFAIWGEWQTLLTGGTIIAISGLVQVLTDKPIPKGANWLIVAMTFIVASFFAWRRERMQRMSDDTKSTRIAVLKLLAREFHCTEKDIFEKTGATLDLLVQMHAAGELYISSNGWVMREKPTPRK